MTAELTSNSHFLKLLQKEDFSSIKPGIGRHHLSMNGIELRAHNGAYPFSMFSEDVSGTARFSEGRMEGNAIHSRGDHYSGSGDPQLHISFAHQNVHRFRFAIDQDGGGVPIEYFDKNNQLITKRALNAGWVDFALPYELSRDVSIAKVVIYLGSVEFAGPTVDSFEIFEWTPYSGIPIIPTTGASEPHEGASIWH